MIGYILLIASAILIGLNFTATKFYQKKYGNTLITGLYFNLAAGILTVLFFLLFIDFSALAGWFSLLMVFVQTLLIVLYTLIGFKLMASGTVALYTMFLMAGGMLVPYFWGIAFLGEKVGIRNILGVILILIAVFLMNSGEEKFNKKNFLFLTAVFFINGGVSVVTKLHQTSSLAVAGELEFVWLSGVMRILICGFVLAFIMLKKHSATKEETHGGSKLKALPFMLIPIVLSVIFDKTSFILQLIGAKTTPATMMFPIISGGTVIFTALTSFIIFKEKLSKKSITAIAICLIGTILFI